MPYCRVQNVGYLRVSSPKSTKRSRGMSKVTHQAPCTGLTAQEYYDLLVETSANGGFPVFTTTKRFGKRYTYRTRDKRMCPVGRIIPDEVYTRKFGGLPVPELVEEGLVTPTKNSSKRYVKPYLVNIYVNTVFNAPSVLTSTL